MKYRFLKPIFSFFWHQHFGNFQEKVEKCENTEKIEKIKNSDGILFCQYFNSKWVFHAFFVASMWGCLFGKIKGNKDSNTLFIVNSKQ